MVNVGDVVVLPTLETGLGLADFLQGRAAATFVVLVGIGLWLGFAQHGWDQAFGQH